MGIITVATIIMELCTVAMVFTERIYITPTTIPTRSRYPPADYTWAKATSIQQTSGITGCGEKTCVEDYGRRLVVYNVDETDFGGYFCQVKNSVGLNSLVLNLEEKPKSYDINFLGISPSHTITPNRYEPFNLTCSVDRASTNDVSEGRNGGNLLVEFNR